MLLHSIFSNACHLSGHLYEWVRSVDCPKVYFIGNEYKLMPEKMAFAEALGVTLLVSQSISPAVHDLYRQRLGCAVAGIPSAGLDTAVFYPSREVADRPIDIGYRAYDAPPYLGHDERRKIAQYFLKHAPGHGLTTDITLDPSQRFGVTEWSRFLNRCKGQLGSEAGGDYFELTDATRHKVNEYVSSNPDATMDDIIDRFFQNYTNNTPLRIISGRHVEAASTKTVQILFEGHYSGYFQPDVHYIPLKKDFSNIDDVIAKFRDEQYCRQITDNAYEVATRELTYPRLIDRFHEALTPLL